MAWANQGLPAPGAAIHARNPRWDGPLCRYEGGVEDDLTRRQFQAMTFVLTSEQDSVTCGQCLQRLGKKPPRRMPGQGYLLAMKRKILGENTTP